MVPLRRIPIYVSDDIHMEELIEMASNAGFFLRHVDGATYMDRVPGIIRKDPPPNVVPMKIRKPK